MVLMSEGEDDRSLSGDDSGRTPPSFGEHVGRDPSSDELRRMWKQFELYTRKTIVHKELARFLGEWEVEMDFDMDGYGPNFTMEGKAVGTSLFGGRFVQIAIEANSEAFPLYEALFIIGFDNVIDKTMCVMLENSQNGMLLTEGQWNPERHEIVDWGEMSNAMFRKRHDVSLRWGFESDDEITLTSSVPDFEGNMTQNLRARFLRPGRGRTPPLGEE